MVSVRLSPALLARVDFVVRNTEGDALKNRSAALLDAVEAWLPDQERRLQELLGS